MSLKAKLKRLRKVARAVTMPHTLITDRLQGDPRSVFYGDPIEVSPENAGEAIGHVEPAEDVVPAAVVEETPTDDAALARLQAFNSMSSADKAAVTLLPPLATWNAFVVINPMIGKVLASSLNYMLLKALNDYPYKGQTVQGTFTPDVQNGHIGSSTVLINSASLGGTEVSTGVFSLGRYVAIPFFRFTIASSTLNAQSGGQISIDIIGTDPQGTQVNTASLGYTYAFQRMSTTEAVIGVYIPTQVVATRTLPFLPYAGDAGVESSTVQGAKSLTIRFSGVNDTDQVTVTVPGYASAELREISRMYNLPAGDVR